MEELEAMLADLPSGCQFFAMASPAALAAERLKRLASKLAGADDDDVRWLSERLVDYLENAPRGLSLDAAVGVAKLPYIDEWWNEGRAEERESLIGQLGILVPGKSVNAKAEAIAALAEEYAETLWPEDAELDELPVDYIGTPNEIFWRLHRCKCRWPLSARSIHETLQKCSGEISNRMKLDFI